MRFQRLNRLLWLSLGCTLLIGLYLSRKPLCIDSRVIERLDRIDPASTESVWRCRLGHDAVWGSTMIRKLPSWQKRLQAVEEPLWRLAPFKNPLRVVVLTHRPWTFRLEGETLFIGDRLIDSEGQLEHGLVKAWLRERNPRIAEGSLAEEVLADFIQGAVLGRLTLEDATRGVRTRLGTRWPQVLKDSNGYCASPWKLSEHFELCAKNPDRLIDDAWSLSLRPLLSSTLLATWWDLSLQDRLESYRHLPEWLADGAFPEKDGSDLSGAVQAVQAFRNALTDRARDEASLRPLARAFAERLKRVGFDEGDQRLSLDVLVISDFPVAADDAIAKQLAEVSSSRAGMKIALKDPRRFSLFPSRGALGVENLDSLKIDRLAILRCGRFDFDWVLSFEGVAEKLFVVDVCGSKTPDLRPWILGGPEKFGASNKEFRFIQFHLPSLVARKDSLDKTIDVLSVISKRDVADPAFRTLGWQELRWSQTANAYYPRAQVDAIEWFRIN